MRICVKRYLHRSRVIEQLIDDWKAEQVHGTSSAFLTAVIPECVDVSEFSRQTWEYLRELLRSDPNGDEIENVGKIMKPELPKTLAAFDWVHEMIAGAIGIDAMIEGAATFEAAANQVREVSAKFEMVYPPFDHEAAEESIAEFKRGEYITVEELIEELTGGSQDISVSSH